MPIGSTPYPASRSREFEVGVKRRPRTVWSDGTTNDRASESRDRRAGAILAKRQRTKPYKMGWRLSGSGQTWPGPKQLNSVADGPFCSRGELSRKRRSSWSRFCDCEMRRQTSARGPVVVIDNERPAFMPPAREAEQASYGTGVATGFCPLSMM